MYCYISIFNAPYHINFTLLIYNRIKLIIINPIVIANSPISLIFFSEKLLINFKTCFSLLGDTNKISPSIMQTKPTATKKSNIKS